MSEAGHAFDFGVGVVGLRLEVLAVVVGGDAVVVGNSHVHKTAVLAGPGTIGGHSTGPTFAGAGGGTVSVLQRLVLLVWV